MPKIRRVIAEAMTASLQTAAQLTHNHSFDATQILALRAQFKENGCAFASSSTSISSTSASPAASVYGIDGITLGDMVLYAVAKTLLEHPSINTHLLDGGVLRRWRGVHLGVAIDTPRGIIVPTVFNADEKSLLELSISVKELAAAARSGNISPDALRGATFTVTNLGATGVEAFTPILNLPQVGILGVCGIMARARVGKSGLEAYPAMGLSITYDHRAVDGAPVSRFAQALCKRLEQFQLLLAT
jgi:pyruvate dehydrogenase E2 component (dihydrolipoamide acetyltransferase)